VTYEEWKAEASMFARKLLDLEPIWSEDDPYDLFNVALTSFEQGQTPEAFIKEMFEEDLAAQAYYHHLVEESEIANAEPEST
jgi:hypothetical protein